MRCGMQVLFVVVFVCVALTSTGGHTSRHRPEFRSNVANQQTVRDSTVVIGVVGVRGVVPLATQTCRLGHLTSRPSLAKSQSSPLPITRFVMSSPSSGERSTTTSPREVAPMPVEKPSSKSTSSVANVGLIDEPETAAVLTCRTTTPVASAAAAPEAQARMQNTEDVRVLPSLIVAGNLGQEFHPKIHAPRSATAGTRRIHGCEVKTTRRAWPHRPRGGFVYFGSPQTYKTTPNRILSWRALWLWSCEIWLPPSYPRLSSSACLNGRSSRGYLADPRLPPAALRMSQRPPPGHWHSPLILSSRPCTLRQPQQ